MRIFSQGDAPLTDKIFSFSLFSFSPRGPGNSLFCARRLSPSDVSACQSGEFFFFFAFFFFFSFFSLPHAYKSRGGVSRSTFFFGEPGHGAFPWLAQGFFRSPRSTFSPSPDRREHRTWFEIFQMFSRVSLSLSSRCGSRAPPFSRVDSSPHFLLNVLLFEPSRGISFPRLFDSRYFLFFLNSTKVRSHCPLPFSPFPPFLSCRHERLPHFLFFRRI